MARQPCRGVRIDGHHGLEAYAVWNHLAITSVVAADVMAVRFELVRLLIAAVGNLAGR